ncbi:MAG: virulence protein RhuM/Fic/DOC family protein [Prolixibacteraceae bacterium]|jgi:prophage maintenance system killer protein|nr:virulence protein RhuM/Fic/DOC family protein [Prolixibacteraceae bacterium]MBT6999313.1 virulence protein RhuM/Fic/DOC family protein [Prolixibacteraceae bacterium]MBT7393209.1 virulence protein RhuM/Fic/DOC family protein [Prolixibacteraceae bacterium]
MNNLNIKIYQSKDGQTEVQVKVEKETVWLSQKQMAQLFDKDTDTIGLHLKNIYKSGELDEISTTEDSSVIQLEGKRNVKRNIKLYNLDAIISVGYRVNSKRGIQFRIWANKILKEYLIKGYALNERKLSEQNKQLKDLQNSIMLLGNTLNFNTLSSDESSGLLKIISDYAYALDILDQYDYQSLKIRNTSGKETYKLTYEEAINQIQIVKKAHGNSTLFGNEKDDSFQSSVATIYQTFGGNDLYPSIEEKAANLLYFITKNHSFSDGNKRIAAFLFLYFLERNGILFDKNGNKRIADNTLVALTLMIAVSRPDEKDTMTKVIVNLINKNN